MRGRSLARAGAADGRSFVESMARRVAFRAGDGADASPLELAAEDGHSGPPVWVWIIVGVGAVLLLALAVFLVNWFRNRPRKGDNRTEVADAERTVQRRKNAAAARRASAATTRSTRTHETNASVISGESGEGYHGYLPGLAPTSPAGARPSQQRYGSPLVGTELAVSLHPVPRAFSPISDESKDSSEYSQGVDDDGAATRAQLEQRGLLDSYGASDVDSFSSGLSIGEDSARSDAPYPRKKSIEF